MSKVKFIAFAKKNWAAMLVLCLSSIALIWFVGSFLFALIYFNDPRHQDEALKGWMTPRYVVMSYDLPREIVADLLDLPAGGPGDLKLDAIAQGLGLTLVELTTIVRDAAAAHREGVE